MRSVSQRSLHRPEVESLPPTEVVLHPVLIAGSFRTYSCSFARLLAVGPILVRDGKR